MTRRSSGRRDAAGRRRPADELVLWCYGVAVRLVDATGLGLGRRLREELPPEFAPAAPAAPAAPPAGATVTYRVTVARPPRARLRGAGPSEAAGPEYLVACDGVAVFATAAEGELAWWLRRDIDQAVARRAPGLLFVHAGVVGWRGLAIVVPGRGAIGKTRLVAELVRRGAVYYSDTFAVLDEAGRVHPYRGPLGPGEEGEGAPRDLRLVREGEPAEPLPLGLLVAGRYLPHDSWRPAIAIVRGAREDVAADPPTGWVHHWRPAIVRGARAALPLVDSTVLARDQAPRLGSLVARLAPTVVTLRGPWPEAREVAAQLLDLVDDALVSHALGAPGNGPRGAPGNGAGGLTEDLARVAALRLRSRSPTEASPYQRGSRAKRLVAVVAPMHRFPLSADEQISVRHLREYLGGFDRYMIGPQRPPKEFADFALPPGSARFFADRNGYNQLLLSEQFYRAFTEYEYILIYQLDCLVFSSDLEEWCRKGWDYVGAPWFDGYSRDGWEYVGPPWHDEWGRRCDSYPYPDDPVDRYGTVGNGGLSLRKVDTALAVLRSARRPLYDPLQEAVLTYPGTHEDVFWSFSAPKLVDTFRIPKPREALKFAFETEVRYCYQENGGRLPFGCHAWPVHEREFWEPFLLK